MIFEREYPGTDFALSYPSWFGRQTCLSFDIHAAFLVEFTNYTSHHVEHRSLFLLHGNEETPTANIFHRYGTEIFHGSWGFEKLLNFHLVGILTLDKFSSLNIVIEKA